jgi:hypothetical protein
LEVTVFNETVEIKAESAPMVDSIFAFNSRRFPQ